MLSHGYHEALTSQIGYCWQRTAEDVLWTPLPMFHYNALVTAVLGSLVFGGRSAIYRRFSVSNFWPEMNRTGATITSTLGTMAYLLAHDEDRPEMPKSGAPEANTTLRLLGAAPLPVEVDDIIQDRFGLDDVQRGLRRDRGQPHLVVAGREAEQAERRRGDQRRVLRRPHLRRRRRRAAAQHRRRDRHPPQAPPRDVRGLLGPARGHRRRPAANWWYHTGDIGRIDDDGYLFFVDRKADYLRRRGENIS